MQNKSAWSAFLSTSMLFLCACFASGQQAPRDSLRYLALGDSYTIGTGVLPPERFPVQLVKALQQRGIAIQKPKIIARLGWSTDQLSAAMDREQLQGSSWDLVTLLIGVNNQYRGGSLEQYQLEFRVLLDRAIALAGQDPKRVIVLSIPDYGVTPFGQRLQAARIRREIDAFNAANRAITLNKGARYCDITPLSREALHHKNLTAEDKLHPSGEMYRRWVALLLDLIRW